LSTARGRRPHSRPREQFFSHTDRLSLVNNMFIFFPAVNWLYRLQMGLFTQLLPFNGLARRLATICKKQRTSNSDSRQKKDVLKNIRFLNYFMLAVFILLIKFSKIVFALRNFVRSLKFYYKNNFCPSLHAFKINWIGLFYFKLNSRKWENSFCVLQRNSPKYSNDQSGKLDWNWLKFYGKRNTGLHAITAPSYKQPNKLSQLQNTHLNLLTVTFLAISKWTEINLRWLIVDGCVKEGKRLTITVTFRSEI